MGRRTRGTSSAIATCDVLSGMATPAAGLRFLAPDPRALHFKPSLESGPGIPILCFHRLSAPRRVVWQVATTHPVSACRLNVGVNRPFDVVIVGPL